MTATTPDPSISSPSRESSLRVAILGATGLVGGKMARLLDERSFPLTELVPLASARSASKTLRFRGADVPVREVSAEALEGIDLVLASAGDDVSREWLPIAAEKGAVCIDNTSAFRMEPGVPLVVPEVNSDRLADIRLGGGGAIIANPNCSTIQLVVALEPLRRAFGLERVLVSTYQSISGAGRAAVDQFQSLSRGALEEGASTPLDAGLPVFDVLPRIGDFDDAGHTSEERKMIDEVPKILGEDVPLDVTCVRVPVFTGHAESVVVQTREPTSVAEAKLVLAGAPGLRLGAGGDLPTPASITGSLDVHVARVRASRTLEGGLQFWVVADNLLKGAAWNAVQIAEELVSSEAARRASNSAQPGHAVA